jgi:hypothetical protein
MPCAITIISETIEGELNNVPIVILGHLGAIEVKKYATLRGTGYVGCKLLKTENGWIAKYKNESDRGYDGEMILQIDLSTISAK